MAVFTYNTVDIEQPHAPATTRNARARGVGTRVVDGGKPAQDKKPSTSVVAGSSAPSSKFNPSSRKHSGVASTQRTAQQPEGSCASWGVDGPSPFSDAEPAQTSTPKKSSRRAARSKAARKRKADQAAAEAPRPPDAFERPAPSRPLFTPGESQPRPEAPPASHSPETRPGGSIIAFLPGANVIVPRSRAHASRVVLAAAGDANQPAAASEVERRRPLPRPEFGPRDTPIATERHIAPVTVTVPDETREAVRPQPAGRHARFDGMSSWDYGLRTPGAGSLSQNVFPYSPSVRITPDAARPNVAPLRASRVSPTRPGSLPSAPADSGSPPSSAIPSRPSQFQAGILPPSDPPHSVRPIRTISGGVMLSHKARVNNPAPDATIPILSSSRVAPDVLPCEPCHRPQPQACTSAEESTPAVASYTKIPISDSFRPGSQRSYDEMCSASSSSGKGSPSDNEPHPLGHEELATYYGSLLSDSVILDEPSCTYTEAARKVMVRFERLMLERGLLGIFIVSKRTVLLGSGQEPSSHFCCVLHVVVPYTSRAPAYSSRDVVRATRAEATAAAAKLALSSLLMVPDGVPLAKPASHIPGRNHNNFYSPISLRWTPQRDDHAGSSDVAGSSSQLRESDAATYRDDGSTHNLRSRASEDYQSLAPSIVIEDHDGPDVHSCDSMILGDTVEPIGGKRFLHPRRGPASGMQRSVSASAGQRRWAGEEGLDEKLKPVVAMRSVTY